MHIKKNLCIQPKYKHIYWINSWMHNQKLNMILLQQIIWLDKFTNQWTNLIAHHLKYCPSLYGMPELKSSKLLGIITSQKFLTQLYSHILCIRFSQQDNMTMCVCAFHELTGFPNRSNVLLLILCTSFPWSADFVFLNIGMETLFYLQMFHAIFQFLALI